MKIINPKVLFIAYAFLAMHFLMYTSKQKLPKIFITVLSKIKRQTNIPVFLPSVIPKPFCMAKHVISNISVNSYSIILYYRLHIGDAGLAGDFNAYADAKYKPNQLKNIRSIQLNNHIDGYFRSVSCGGSCAQANLW